MSADQPVVAALQFAQTLIAGDEAAARKSVSKSVWKGSVGACWAQLRDAEATLSTDDTAKAMGGRAVVRADVLDADGNVTGRRFVLCTKHRAAWKIGGISASARHAWVFLDGRIDAEPKWGASSEAKQFLDELVLTLANDKGEALPDDLPEGHPYQRILADIRGQVLEHKRTPSAIAVRALNDLDRMLIGIQFDGAEESAERWLVLGRHEQSPNLMLLIAARGPNDLDAALADLEPEWADLESDMADDNDKKLSPEQARELVNQVVTGAMKEMGYDQEGDSPDFSGVAEGDLKGKIPELVYNLLQSAITEKQSGTAAPAEEAPEAAPAAAEQAPQVVDLGAERQKREPREPSGFEKNISASLSDAVSGYVGENVDGDEVKVDAEFLKDHGPKLFANLFGAFVKSIVPEDMKIDVPVSTTDEDGTRQVNMKLDVGEMLAKVLEPVQRAAENVGNDDDSDDDDAEEEG
ncbi:MAG: hypothetical protein KC912_18495 [Proteobacteria bacterium]|nr:hypothetical protein [Pseudomonadota bacterium]